MTEDTKPRYDAIIALSRNWKPELPKDLRDLSTRDLRVDSRMNAIAAGFLLDEDYTDNLVICGGKTRGEDYASESGLMGQYIRNHFPHLNSKSIMTEEHSIDTAGNAEVAREIVRKNRFEKLALLTVGVHLPRSLRVFREYGMNCDGITSESVLLKRSEHYERFIGSFNNSFKYSILEDFKELFVLQPLTFFNPSGSWLRYITSKMPTRVGK